MSDPTPDEIAAARAPLESTGAEVRVPHPSTVRRREQRSHRAIAVINRSGRSYRQVDGRVYGEPPPPKSSVSPMPVPGGSTRRSGSSCSL